MGEYKQAGGLYRSISQGADRRLSPASTLRKSRASYSLTNGVSPAHGRNYSETSVPSGSGRRQKLPEARCASALDYSYGSKSIDSMLYERSKNITNGHSSPSSRWQTSSLSALREEDSGPATKFTNSDVSENRGLGIRNHRNHSRHTSNDSGFGLTRSQSQISTRELRDQMTGLKNKIADLRTEQQADQSRRNSLQSLRTSSPIAAAEEWYAGAAEYKGGGSPLSTNAGKGWRAEMDVGDSSARLPASPRSLKSPQSPKSPRSPRSPSSPQSPSSPKDSVMDDTPGSFVSTAHCGQDLHSYSSTPNPPPTLRAVVGDRDDQDSYIQDSHYEDAFEGRSIEAEDSVAASEEEQIYLNEVLEESLQDAEPEVPPIPDVVQLVEAERHEDRADAFDYENFFLHSALGNYSQTSFHRRNISQATADSRISYESSDSVETTRAPQADEKGAGFEQSSEEDEELEDGPESTAEGTFLQDDLPTPKAPRPSYAQHLRSNSIDSVSSAATFATATEGGNDSGAESDTVPSEILNWGDRPIASMVGAWPSPPASAPRGLSNLPNGYASSPGTNLLQHESLAPSSDALPTPPASSPLQHQQMDPQETNSDPEDADADSDADADDQTSTSSSQHQPPNTEILISALITLANPDFRPTGPFSEIDKDLVVNVLRSVGAVCEGINASDYRGEVYESRVWRRRLDMARRILEGEVEVVDE
jgi:hypothetical protein